MAAADDVGPFLWVNGTLSPTAEAVVSATDHGVIVGDGAFETIPVVRGRAFALDCHLARLRRTLEGLGLACSTTDSELGAAVDAVIAANGDRAGRLRLTVTGGPSALGSERLGTVTTVLVGSTRAIPRSPTTAVVTVRWRRNERGALVGLKTTSYAENVKALATAQAAGASEAIFLNTRDELCEGTGSNIFVVLDDTLVTPPLSSGCLDGITRALLMQSISVVERPVPVAELDRITAAFLTSSTRDVQPIHRWDARPLEQHPILSKVLDAWSDVLLSHIQ